MKRLYHRSVWCLLLVVAIGADEDEQLRVIISYKNTDGLATARIRPDMVHYQLDDTTVAVTLPSQAAIEALRDDPTVDFVEPDPIRFLMTHSHDPGAGSLRARALAHSVSRNFNATHPHRRLAEQIPYGVRMVQADTLSAGPSPRTVCIIDSGYTLGHEDLPLATGYSSSSRRRWDEDLTGHGTHVAGTMAAIRNNGRGVYGVVDNVNLFITRVFFESGEASFGSSVIAAARKCRDQGAHIINMSLGGFRPTIVERKAYESIARSGILIVAAAGNEFSNECVYPGAYPSVLSVAAVDSNKAVPSFSSHHNQVELSAPGVAVWSTVPLSESDTIGSVIINGMTFIANPMIGSNRGTVSGALVDCGQGIEEQDVGSCDNNVAAGRICLMVRGGGSFAQKVRFCERNGGVAAIVYNNNTGPIRGTLGNYQSTIPAITLLQSEGRNIVENFAPSIATISVELTRYYASLQGTSMATPHVSGVAALIWSHHPSCTASQIRDIMACTSEDLGSKGHDNYYGYGLVQAQAALNLLNQNGCGACTGFVSLRECQVKRPVGLESCSSRDRCNCGRNQCFTIHRITRTRSCRSLCAGGIMLRLRLIFRYDCGACPSTLNVPDEATAVL